MSKLFDVKHYMDRTALADLRGQFEKRLRAAYAPLRPAMAPLEEAIGLGEAQIAFGNNSHPDALALADNRNRLAVVMGPHANEINPLVEAIAEINLRLATNFDHCAICGKSEINKVQANKAYCKDHDQYSDVPQGAAGAHR